MVDSPATENVATPCSASLSSRRQRPIAAMMPAGSLLPLWVSAPSEARSTGIDSSVAFVLEGVPLAAQLAYVGRHRRYAASHRFRHGDRHTLAARREHEYLRPAQQVGNVVALAQEIEVSLQPKRPRLRVKSRK